MQRSSTIVKWFNYQLQRNDMNAYRLAKKARISPETVRSILSGRIDPDMDTVARLNAALNTSFAEFFLWMNNPKMPQKQPGKLLVFPGPREKTVT